MDYAEKGDLYARIRRQKKENLNKPFPEKLILKWFTQIALAVSSLFQIFYFINFFGGLEK